jgi:hypothetical protein
MGNREDANVLREREPILVEPLEDRLGIDLAEPKYL